jgi:hypothetical protein
MSWNKKKAQFQKKFNHQTTNLWRGSLPMQPVSFAQKGSYAVADIGFIERMGSHDSGQKEGKAERGTP